ncbi:hypothetical protein FHS49_001649 [Sphingobium boeckii]|uniref:Secreted protein n=1 Tax=Sphingobium boeckii TaxID=1082345 RepID=A0A7W9EFF6_9SPHN|nr:hypothetical protein [Sphingobium boeckii]
MRIALCAALMITPMAALGQAGPWEKYQEKPPVEKLGPGPHTLMISDGSAFTRTEYKTGLSCQRARDEVRRQVAPPPNTRGMIYGPARVTAFCVPR